MIQNLAVEVAHYSPLVTLVGLALITRKHEVPGHYWLIVAAFLVSTFTDTIRVVTEVPWVLTAFYPSVQLGLLGLAFGANWIPLVLLALSLPVIMFGIPTQGPELLVTTLGSAAVLWISRSSSLRSSMWAYCGGATAFYLLLALSREMWVGYSYHGCRLLAFALFLRAAYLGRATPRLVDGTAPLRQS